jgi:hypothetical protein
MIPMTCSSSAARGHRRHPLTAGRPPPNSRTFLEPFCCAVILVVTRAATRPLAAGRATTRAPVKEEDARDMSSHFVSDALRLGLEKQRARGLLQQQRLHQR